MIIKNENNDIINHNIVEDHEWRLVTRYVKPHHQILELGARYGSSSVACNKIIIDKTKQISVEPDPFVWGALENNKRENNCDFNIIKGAISKTKLKISDYSYSTYTEEGDGVEIYDLWNLQNIYDIKINAIVADCEGCLGEILKNYIEIFSQVELVIYESDKPDICDYTKLNEILINNGLKCIESGFHCVYVK